MARRQITAPAEHRRCRRRIPVWQKVILAALAAAVVFGLAAVVRKTIRPVRLAWSERAAVRRLEAELAARKRENQALLEKRRYLQTPPGAETEARKLGFVRPGEVLIMIDDEQKPKKDGSTSEGREKP